MSSQFGNPFLSENVFDSRSTGNQMTRTGTALWTLAFMTVLIGSAAFSWSVFMTEIGDFDMTSLETVVTGQDEEGKDVKEVKVLAESGEYVDVPNFDHSKSYGLMLGGALGAFVVAMLIIPNRKSAQVLGFFYAGLEGLAVGAFSATFELSFPGITMQAAAATIVVAVVMWLLFAAGIIKVTGGFITFVLTMMLGILGLYLVDIGIGIFTGERLDIVHGNSWSSIAVSGVIVFIAALNFCIDYHHIEEGVQSGAPKYMEAYCAFGLMLTIVWCYLEIVRLIAKSRSKNIRSIMWASIVAEFRKGFRRSPQVAVS